MADSANLPRRTRRAIGRVEQALASELQPGESIRTAVQAQRWLPGLEVLLAFGAIGDTIFLVVAKPFYLAASDSRFFFLNSGRFVPSARGLVFSAPLADVRMEQLRRGPLRRQVRITQADGTSYRLAVHRAYRVALEQLESLVGSASSRA